MTYPLRIAYTYTNKNPSISIMGSGLAGILVAQTCIDHGLEIAWMIDSNDPLRGSGSPTALFHPFPGRSMKLHPLLKDAVTTAQRIFWGWQQRYPMWVRETSMVRSFVGLGGTRVKESYERTYIRDGVKIPDWLQLDVLDQKAMAPHQSLHRKPPGPVRLTLTIQDNSLHLLHYQSQLCDSLLLILAQQTQQPVIPRTG